MSLSVKRSVYIVIAALSVILFAVGSFCDLPIAETVYRPNQPVALVFTILGYVLFFGTFQLLTGALFRQQLLLSQTRIKRILCTFICSYTGLSTAVLGGAGMISDSVIGLLFPEMTLGFRHKVLIGIVLFIPPVIFGMFMNGKQAKKRIALNIIILLVIMGISFFGHVIFTSLYSRPRFRITQSGFEGLGFTPWYEPLDNAAFFSETYHLKSDAFRSFFSGHALDAVLNLAIFPALEQSFPIWKEKERFLQITALVLIPPIAFSRMVLGAHYLSDISAGMLCGLGFVILYEIIVHTNKCSANQRGKNV